MKINVGLKLEPELLERLDRACTGTSRSAWIGNAIEAALGGADASEPPRKLKPHSALKEKPRVQAIKPQGPSKSTRRAVTFSSASTNAFTEGFKHCNRGCSVPVGSRLKRCVPHGLELA